MPSAPTAAAETPWVDAWVRWERHSMEVYDDGERDEADDGEDELPPPTESYDFAYTVPPVGNEQEAREIRLHLKGYHDDSEQTWNSTGLTLWRSSHHLCHYLVSEEVTTLRDASNPELRILEVGSGLGRCGLLAHLLSHETATTILTDGDTDALKQLRENVKHNSDKDDDRISCCQLLWGEDSAKAFLARHNGRKFDRIIGSDLIYVNAVTRPLFETARVLLKEEEDSKFLMAHCARREGNEVKLSTVLDVATEEGFGHEVLVEEDDISVFCFRRLVD
ncbi:hypothetical protein ACHAXT_001779 [Thalassiosira profunda]